MWLNTHGLSAAREMWLSLFLSYPGGDTTHMGCLQHERCDYPCFCHIQVETPHTWAVCSIRDVIIPVSVISRWRHHTHGLSAASEMWLSLFLSYPGGDTTHMTYLQQQAADAERKTLTYIRRFNKVQVWPWPVSAISLRRPQGHCWHLMSSAATWGWSKMVVLRVAHQEHFQPW